MGDRDTRHTRLYYAVCIVCMKVPGDCGRLACAILPAPSSPAPHRHAPAAPPLLCCILLSPLVCSGEAPRSPRSACAAHSPSCRRGPGSVCRCNLHKLFSGMVSPAMSPCLLSHVPARRMSEQVQWGIRRRFESAARHAKAGYCGARCRQTRPPPSRPTACHRPRQQAICTRRRLTPGKVLRAARSRGAGTRSTGIARRAWVALCTSSTGGWRLRPWMPGIGLRWRRRRGA